jgi:hypothetical protein
MCLNQSQERKQMHCFSLSHLDTYSISLATYLSMRRLALIITLISFISSSAMISSESKRLKVVLVTRSNNVTHEFKYELFKSKNDNGCT